MDIKKILKDCQTAAETASRAALDQLEAHGPRYSIHEADLLGNATSPSIGTMLDNCGGAYLIIPGNCQFVRELKKIGKNDGRSYPPHYVGDGWDTYKGVYSGYVLSVRFSLSVRQEMAVHESAMKAAANILKSNGIPVSVKTYID